MKLKSTIFLYSLFMLSTLSPAQSQSTLTTHQQLKAKLIQWDKGSANLMVEEIGKSVSGRELFVAGFSRHLPIPERNRSRPLVLIFAQQHGNETSGKEAALQLCEEMAGGKYKNYLEHIDLMIVPQVNPDGSEKGVRRNANDQDLNRNHILLDQPETLALHKLYQKYLPEVTLDVHEYNDFTQSRMAAGWVRAIDEMLGCVTNPNISKKIEAYSQKVITPELGGFVEKSGFSFHPYLVGGPPEKARYRYSTTYINDGRNGLGLYHSLSFIVEGRRYGDTSTNLEKRTAGQKAAMLGLINSVAKHRTEILRLVSQERKKLQRATDNFPLIAPRSNYLNVANITLPLQVELVPGGGVIDTVFQNFSPYLKVPFFLKRPTGYLLPKKMAKWLQVLKRHPVIIDESFKRHECLVERQIIRSVGIFEMEEKFYQDITTQTVPMKLTADASEYLFISTNQLASHLIPLLLEPQSVMCLLQYDGFLDRLKPGMAYPVLRVIEW